VNVADIWIARCQYNNIATKIDNNNIASSTEILIDGCSYLQNEISDKAATINIQVSLQRLLSAG